MNSIEAISVVPGLFGIEDLVFQIKALDDDVLELGVQYMHTSAF